MINGAAITNVMAGSFDWQGELRYILYAQHRHKQDPFDVHSTHTLHYVHTMYSLHLNLSVHIYTLYGNVDINLFQLR